MTLILDAGPMIAMTDLKEPLQPVIQELLEAESGPLAMPAPISAEIDYLVGRRVSSQARRRFLADLAEGKFSVECLDPEDYPVIAALDRRYEDLNLSLADLSIVVIAERLGTRRLLTFDERDFRAVAPLQGGAFELLPADA